MMLGESESRKVFVKRRRESKEAPAEQFALCSVETILTTGCQIKVNEHIHARCCVSDAIDIVADTDTVVAVNKPAGIPTVDECFGQSSALGRVRSRVRGNFTLHSINRLDREVSGLLLFAKGSGTRRRLQDMLDQSCEKKVYVAKVEGRLCSPVTIRSIGLGWDGKEKKANFAGSKRVAETRIVPLRHADNFTVVEVYLKTGQRHQIRRHLASIGHPVAYDELYGARSKSPHTRQLFVDSGTTLLDFFNESFSPNCAKCKWTLERVRKRDGPSITVGILLHAWRYFLADDVFEVPLPEWIDPP